MTDNSKNYHLALECLRFSDLIMHEFVPVISLPSNVFDDLKASLSAPVIPELRGRAFNVEVMLYLGHVVARGSNYQGSGPTFIYVAMMLPR